MVDGQEEVFLFHFTPPAGLGSDPVLMLAEEGREPRLSSLEEVAESDRPLVAHSFNLIAEWLRERELPLPRTVLDLECAQKLVSGRRKGDLGPSKPWDMAEMWFRVLPAGYQTLKVRRALQAHLALPLEGSAENQDWIAAATHGAPDLWKHVRRELEEKLEWKRFIEIEVPAYNRMLASQVRGIAVDTEMREVFLGSIEAEYIAAHHRLAIGLNLDVERALRDISYLESRLAQPVRADEEWMDARALIESRKELDEICRLLDSVATAQLNRSILLRTGGSVGAEGRCYVQFDCMGTVTGRVLTSDPLLQHLSKRYRSLLKPDEGYEFLYVDYAQFEPNIMASLSRDEALLALCNGSDLYHRLAIDVCGDAAARKAMKTVFLAYSYGKQISSLGDLLVATLGSREAAEAAIQAKFLPLFAGVEKWKATIQAELEEKGRIGTVLGNFRYRNRRGTLDAQEKRWAVSQVVQGTGSLILKRVIRSVTEHSLGAEILLPMHDALLLQVPSASAGALREWVLDCFRRSFEEVCPGLAPAVHVDPFTYT